MIRDEQGKISTPNLVIILMICLAVVIAGGVLTRPKVDPGTGEVMTSSTGWGTSHFSNLSAADIEATDDLTVGDDAVIAGYLRVGASTKFSVTSGGTITPTGTYMPLESGAAVGSGDIITGTAGDRLVLINTCANTITISDTGSLKLMGDRALGQYDVLELWSDGTYWLETSFVDSAGDDLTVADDLTVTDDVSIGGTLTVATLVTETTDLSLTGDLTVADVGTLAGMEADYITGTVSGTVPDWTVSDDLTVTDVGTLGGMSAGYITGTVSGTVPDWTVSDDLTVTDDSTLGGIVSVGEFLRIAEQTSITVTNGAVFTPTGSYQPITSAGTVTPTVSTSGYTAGDLLWITNETATTITFVDSGTAMLFADRDMGRYDVLGLLFDGTNWLEVNWGNN